MSKDEPNRKGRKPSLEDVAAQLIRLSKSDAGELRAFWREYFGRPAPFRFRRDMMAHVLAYDIQVKVRGGLSKAATNRLDKIAAEEFGEAIRKGRHRLTPGTRLVRDWHGVTHEVYVTDGAFVWQGTPYRSLSAIARAITGTRWSGPAFFGIRSLSDAMHG